MTKIKSILTILLLTVLLWQAVGSQAWCAGKDDGSLVSGKLIAQRDRVRVELITYMSDGLRVKGFLFVPVDAHENQQKLPCVIFCHDGISGVTREHRLSSIRLANSGFVVFSPSYRGEDGSQGEIEIAKGEVRDVLNAMTLMEKHENVDGPRMALTGASHGALIAVLAASRTDRVKALVSAYGVMDIYKWWDYLKENNMIGKDKYTRQTYGKGPQDRPVSFAIRNAVSFVENIKCPVLILQGEKDKIVPPQQARYLKESLDKHKIPARLELFPDALHGFLIYVPYIKDDVEEAEREQTRKAWEIMIKFLKDNLE